MSFHEGSLWQIAQEDAKKNEQSKQPSKQSKDSELVRELKAQQKENEQEIVRLKQENEELKKRIEQLKAEKPQQ